MQGLRYLEDAVTLSFDADKCTGCRVCTMVCPHGVFAMGADKRAYIADRGACMECGACALNCAWGAISVKPGVGCAEAIIHSWIYGGEPSCGCSMVPGATSDAGRDSTGSSCSPGSAAQAPAASPEGSTSSCCGSSADASDTPQDPGAA